MRGGRHWDTFKWHTTYLPFSAPLKQPLVGQAKNCTRQPKLRESRNACVEKVCGRLCTTSGRQKLPPPKGFMQWIIAVVALLPTKRWFKKTVFLPKHEEIAIHYQGSLGTEERAQKERAGKGQEDVTIIVSVLMFRNFKAKESGGSRFIIALPILRR